MREDTLWFENFRNSHEFSKLKTNPIAYFCAEYALTSDLQIYSGGLGVLAGDYLREADDQNFPLVALGLYYSDGYETPHRVDERGFINTPHVHASPKDYGLIELVDDANKQILIDVPIQDKTVKARVLKWNVGVIPLYLLNTDVEGNSPEDRKITDHLYVADRETRFKQAIVLGVGGIRLLEKLEIKPSIYHMNEGFAHLLCLELVRGEMSANRIGFEEAKNRVSPKIVYTNHTLVTGGHDIYKSDLLNVGLAKYITELGVSLNQILSLGSAEDSKVFSTTLFSLRFADGKNAVSNLHAAQALKIWPDSPVLSITNGINLSFWDKVGEGDIWRSHLENKEVLLEKVKSVTGQAWNKDSLIIGWARRLVTYKRPLVLFENIEGLKKLLDKINAKIVISGTLHPGDIESRYILEEFRNIPEEKLAGYAAFLPDYNLSLAKILTAGCDVWLNTPAVGFEACGTSGMKAALNGVLPLSTRDGWMDEVDFLGIGWQLDNDRISQNIYEALEGKVAPLYFEQDSSGISENWVSNMRNARELIKSRFSTTRMLRDYIEKLYLPPLGTKT